MFETNFALALILGMAGFIVISTASVLGIIEISRERSAKNA